MGVLDVAAALGQRSAAEEARFFRSQEADAFVAARGRVKSIPSSSSSATTSLLSAADRARLEALTNDNAHRATTRVVRAPSHVVRIDKSLARHAPRDNVLDFLRMPGVSFGKAKWEAQPNASVFSIADGKRLALTPVVTKHTKSERARLATIEGASVDATIYKGYRMYPKFSAGRALAWGSVLAFWGSSMLVAGTAKALGIHSTDDLGDFVRRHCEGPVSHAQRALETLKPTLGPKQSHGARLKTSPLMEHMRARFA